MSEERSDAISQGMFGILAAVEDGRIEDAIGLADDLTRARDLTPVAAALHMALTASARLQFPDASVQQLAMINALGGDFEIDPPTGNDVVRRLIGILERSAGNPQLLDSREEQREVQQLVDLVPSAELVHIQLLMAGALLELLTEAANDETAVTWAIGRLRSSLSD